MTTNMWTRLFAAAAALGMVLSASAVALGAPDSFMYVGELWESMAPVDDTVDVEIRLFDAGTDGNMVWGPEEQMDVDVVGGLFRIAVGMGSTAPLWPALMNNDNVWIEISVDGTALSRQRIGSSVYAQVAGFARNLAGNPPSDYVTDEEAGMAGAMASSSETAPADPVAGQFWWNPADGEMYVWQGGEWNLVSAGNLEPSNLPSDGLLNLSNGLMSNTFNGVSHLWTTEADIQDATLVGPGAPAQATVSVAEATGSYITGVTVLTKFSLSSSSDIEMRLFPPPALGLDPIVLLPQGQLPFGTYADDWTVAEIPELADLLNTNPAGVWTLAIQDFDNNLSDGGPNVSGTLESFEVNYNIVRSDNVSSQGSFTVGTLQSSNTLAAELVPDTDFAVTGNVVTTGEVRRTLTHRQWQQNWDSSGNISNRTITFTKTRDDTALYFELNDTLYDRTTGNVRFRLRLDGQNCVAPGELLWWHRCPNSSNGYDIRTINFKGICQGFQNIGDGTFIPAGTYTAQINVDNSVYMGWDNSIASFVVEEIYLEQATVPTP